MRLNFPHHKVLIILWIDNHESMVGISFGKGFGQFGLLAATPFEFVGMQKAVDLFVFMIVGLVGFNFLFELLFNIVLSPMIVRLIQMGTKAKIKSV